MAGRISRRTVEAVRERADLVEMVSARTGAVRRVRGQVMARCPFHDERTPSFSIEPVAKLYHCFGCGEAGDVFTMVERWMRRNLRAGSFCSSCDSVVRCSKTAFTRRSFSATQSGLSL